jgi:hypothetical protein
MRLSRHPALVMLASITLFVAGGGTLLYGFSTLAYDLPLASTLLPLAAGAALVAASVSLALVTERQLRRDEAERKALVVGSPPAPPSLARKRTKPVRAAAVQPDRVLAQWTLTADEWRAFNEQEAVRKRSGAVEHALVGAAFGAAVPWVFAGHWQYSAIGAVVAGLLAAAWTLVSAARLRTREPRAGGGVVVRRNAVEIDGVTAPLRDDTWSLSGVKLREDLPLPMLELTVKKATHQRNGNRRMDERVVRVPVPRDRVAEAGSVAEQLRRGIPGEDDG